MFIRKFLQGETKLSWIIVDLIIVIIGVYTAFLIQNYSERAQDERERDKVLTALKYELEAFRLQFPIFADYMDNYNDRIKDQEEIRFGGWRYIEPQYAYQIVEYSINLENNEIIDFELYNVLQTLFVRIKQLEHVERLIMDYSGRYKLQIKGLASDHPSNLEIAAENSSNQEYFKLYISSRPESLRRVAEVSRDALVIIDQYLGVERSREIEIEILRDNVDKIANWGETIDEAINTLDGLFPKLTAQEIRDIYNETLPPKENTE